MLFCQQCARIKRKWINTPFDVSALFRYGFDAGQIPLENKRVASQHLTLKKGKQINENA